MAELRYPLYQKNDIFGYLGSWDEIIVHVVPEIKCFFSVALVSNDQVINIFVLKKSSAECF